MLRPVTWRQCDSLTCKHDGITLIGTFTWRGLVDDGELESRARRAVAGEHVSVGFGAVRLGAGEAEQVYGHSDPGAGE